VVSAHDTVFTVHERLREAGGSDGWVAVSRFPGFDGV
jgi:hypothetical protein